MNVGDVPHCKLVRSGSVVHPPVAIRLPFVDDAFAKELSFSASLSADGHTLFVTGPRGGAGSQATALKRKSCGHHLRRRFFGALLLPDLGDRVCSGIWSSAGRWAFLAVVMITSVALQLARGSIAASTTASLRIRALNPHCSGCRSPDRRAGRARVHDHVRARVHIWTSALPDRTDGIEHEVSTRVEAALAELRNVQQPRLKLSKIGCWPSRRSSQTRTNSSSTPARTRSFSPSESVRWTSALSGSKTSCSVALRWWASSSRAWWPRSAGSQLCWRSSRRFGLQH